MLGGGTLTPKEWDSLEHYRMERERKREAYTLRFQCWATLALFALAALFAEWVERGL